MQDNIFQLGNLNEEQSSARGAADPFEKFGYSRNPFPAAGLGLPRAPKYFEHMRPEIERIDRWLLEVAQQTSFGRVPQPIGPLALWGTIGVGKSHLLRLIDEGLQRYPAYSVLRISLTEAGMARLKLADLLLRGLPGLGGEDHEPQPDHRSGLPLLNSIVKYVRRMTDRSARETFLARWISQSSPLYLPLTRVCESTSAQTSEQIGWLASWLMRGSVTSTQRTKLGLSGPLQSEGAAVRAAADLVRLGHASQTMQVWFILIDQLEDLWRPTAITPGGRARFLTDLRLLIDQGLEGAPVALLLAGNSATMGGDPKRDPLFEEYAALWRRLGEPVHIPGLREEDIWPFASRYLEVADTVYGLQGKDGLRAKLKQELEQRGTEAVLKRLRQDPQAVLGGNARFATYRVLDHWREHTADISAH